MTQLYSELNKSNEESYENEEEEEENKEEEEHAEIKVKVIISHCSRSILIARC